MRYPLQVAETVLDELRINSIEDLQLLDEIAFARWAIVKRKPLGSAEARLVIGSPYSVITVSTTTVDRRRVRFSIAHELGHLEMHRREPIFPCGPDSINAWPSKQSATSLEIEANEFAAALLLPEQLFAPLCTETDPSMDVVVSLANKFKVSRMATARRYVQFCYDPVAVVWSERRYIRWFQSNQAFAEYGFFVDVNSLLNDATVASRFFNDEQLPTVPRSVRASAWMMSGEFKDILLQEQCIGMPNYEGVLSLLWVGDDWLADDSWF